MTRKSAKPLVKLSRAPTPKAAVGPADAPLQFDLPIEPRLHSVSRAFAPTPSVLEHFAPVKVSEVYESYWRFAAERQAIFARRACGKKRPWTEDAVLGTYKFTNAYRVTDRVSQFLLRHVIYRDDLPNTPREVFFSYPAVQIVQ